MYSCSIGTVSSEVIFERYRAQFPEVFRLVHPYVYAHIIMDKAPIGAARHYFLFNGK